MSKQTKTREKRKKGRNPKAQSKMQRNETKQREEEEKREKFAQHSCGCMKALAIAQKLCSSHTTIKYRMKMIITVTTSSMMMVNGDRHHHHDPSKNKTIDRQWIRLQREGDRERERSNSWRGSARLGSFNTPKAERREKMK